MKSLKYGHCALYTSDTLINPSTRRYTYRVRRLNINSLHFNSTGHFRVPPGLCFKTRVGAQPLIWKSFFILMQIKLIFTRKVVHLASFWKWGFLELGSDLLWRFLHKLGNILNAVNFTIRKLEYLCFANRRQNKQHFVFDKSTFDQSTGQFGYPLFVTVFLAIEARYP